LADAYLFTIAIPRYSKGARPEKGKNIASAVWPTDASMCRKSQHSN
jgi:hypothetical protein